MATMKMKNAALVFVVILSAAAEEAAEEGGCTEEVTSFSACLPYVSNPPNNLTESASENCCNAFSSGVDSLCLCYLIREPLILGFPLNTTRLLSLSSLCPSQTSLALLCSLSPGLPPLNSAPTQQTIGTSSGISGGRSESGGNGESIGRRVPIIRGYPATNNEQSSNAETLTLLINTFLFSHLLSILVTLLNTS